MKIFFDARALTNKRTSGIDEYIRLLTEKLLDIDHKNKYEFFTNGFTKSYFPKAFEEKENVSRISWRIPNKILDSLSLVFHEPKINRITNADIIFSPHFNLLNVSKNSKRIITFHDLSFIHFPEFYPLRKRFWHFQQDLKRQIKEATRIIAVSDFTAQDLKNTFSVPEEKIQRIYSGINTFYKKLPKDETLKFRESRRLKNPFLLFVGVLEPRKNIGSVIASFSALKEKYIFRDLKLVIAGKNGWLCDKIFKEASHSKSKNDIIFWGESSFEDLRFLYNTCEAFIYPSFFEGFGFPPLEAQACGAPVVISNRSSFPEIIGNSGFLVDPWRIDEQISALEELLTNNSLRSKFVERGFKNTERFSWETTAHEFLKTFNAAVKYG